MKLSNLIQFFKFTFDFVDVYRETPIDEYMFTLTPKQCLNGNDVERLYGVHISADTWVNHFSVYTEEYNTILEIYINQ